MAREALLELVSSADSKLDLAAALSTAAIHVGQLAQDLHAIQRSPDAWITLAPSQTSGSSIMPQKRNPRPLDGLRRLATGVVADAHAVVLQAHNTNTGMHDDRDPEPVLESAARARQMYELQVCILAGLVVDPARARREIDAEWSTTTEVADTLLREAAVPFRVGHRYASRLADYGRASRRRARDLTAAELKRPDVASPAPRRRWRPPSEAWSRSRRPAADRRNELPAVPRRGARPGPRW